MIVNKIFLKTKKINIYIYSKYKKVYTIQNFSILKNTLKFILNLAIFICFYYKNNYLSKLIKNNTMIIIAIKLLSLNKLIILFN